jgi:hypothetical protein
MGPGNGSQLGNFVAAFLLVLVGYLYGDERGIEKPRVSVHDSNESA